MVMGKLHTRLYKTDRARDFDHEQVGSCTNLRFVSHLPRF